MGEGLLESRPARGRQEVVVHTPRHARSLAELDPQELGRVAETWQARAAAAREEGFPYVQALVNEGAAAGASREHTHSQLVWLEREPPAVAGERGKRERAGGCPLCELLATERDGGLRLVFESDGIAVLSTFAARAPYELLLAPSACEEDPFTSERLAAALEALAEALRRLQGIEGSVPVNAWLHPGGHWHLELLPRLTIQAGLELGAEIWVNPLAPEAAAAALRETSLP